MPMRRSTCLPCGIGGEIPVLRLQEPMRGVESTCSIFAPLSTSICRPPKKLRGPAPMVPTLLQHSKLPSINARPRYVSQSCFLSN